MTRPPLSELFDLDKLNLDEHQRLIDLLRMELTGHRLDAAEAVEVEHLLTRAFRQGVTDAV